MNRFHRRYCASAKWEKLMLESLLRTPWTGSPSETMCWWDRAWPDYPGAGPHPPGHGRRDRPGTNTYGAGTDALVRQRQGGRRGCDCLPFDDARFSSVVCMTMLHHLHDAAAQDRLFAEARRVLLPGGVICGSDNLGRGIRFRLIHIGDTRTVVDPETLPARLKSAGFDRVDVRTGSRLVFHGYTRKAV